MNKDNLIKILIPIVALVVVVESVVLVSGLNNSTVQTDKSNESEVTVVPTTKIEEKPVADFVFETSTKEMKVGKAYKVVLSLSANKDFSVDGVEVHMKYDPEKLAISKLLGGNDLPETATLKVDSGSGLVNGIFLVPVEDKTGYMVNTGESKEILSFMVTPKEVGAFDLYLETDNTDGDLPTVLPETGTNKSLLFTTNKLEVNVTK